MLRVLFADFLAKTRKITETVLPRNLHTRKFSKITVFYTQWYILKMRSYTFKLNTASW